ncbi:MAG TPA: hypothetical protein VIF62_13820, partial [Labilithrix sp.]
MRRAAILVFAPFALLACGDAGHGDTDYALGVPPPNGKDQHISDIGDPSKPNHSGFLVSGNTVNISGAIVSNVDNYDETGDGKSKGTIYVQDLGSKLPYGGSSLFSPSFVPGDLHVSSLDVLDLSGQYVEEQNIGAAVFAMGATLEQFSKPTATFRFEV